MQKDVEYNPLSWYLHVSSSKL